MSTWEYAEQSRPRSRMAPTLKLLKTLRSLGAECERCHQAAAKTVVGLGTGGSVQMLCRPCSQATSATRALDRQVAAQRAEFRRLTGRDARLTNT